MLARVSIGLMFLVIFTFDNLQHGPLALARSISRRAVPQFMEDESAAYEEVPWNQQPREHRQTHIVKIHSKKTQRSNDNVLGDVTNFRGIGVDHHAFGGPKYAGEYYPYIAEQNLQTKNRANNFSFGTLLSGLALWNLANEFNMYTSQDPQQFADKAKNSHHTQQHHQQRDHRENS